MRLLFVAPFYYPEQKFGGPPQKLHALSCGLLRREYEVEVLTFHSEKPNGEERVPIDGVPVTYLPWKGRGLRQWPLKRRWLANATKKCDIVHCYGLYNLICPFAVREAARQKKPIVVEPLGMFPPRARKRLPKYIYNASLTKWMMKSASAVIATSEAEASDLRQIADPDKIVLRRNGIDVASFASLPSGKHRRTRWRVIDKETLILFVGRLSPIKNLEQFLLAFKSAKVKSAKVVLVGPAETAYEARLRDLVRREDIQDVVIFAGPLYGDEQKAALAAADLFVLPSLNESFGNAAGEAVAANVPVLLTDTCGIAPLIHGRAGLAVPLGEESFADGLRKMLDPAFRDRMTAKREEVKRELSWEEPIAQTEALYERLIANRGARDAK